ncbi:hypothetical protein SBA3_2230002 [Candidatus Sulfopaludibacter sp. SbA3]|nr:hypothetical protein SBA3_2230002 [Candidatus Sulfopaludibacter sp. SbA3]
MLGADASATPCEILAYCDVPGEVAPEFRRFCVKADEAPRDAPPAEWQATGCVADPKVRAAMYPRFRDRGYVFAKVCHPDATLFAEQIGPGCIVFLGARSVIAPGVQLGGRIVCGKRAVFGIGSRVLQGKRIGDDGVISAGSSVWTDVPAGCTVVGVPAVARKMPGRSFAPPVSQPAEGNQNL